MQIEAPDAVAPSWEHWQCDRCGTENRFRGFCSACGVQFDTEQAIAPTAPMMPLAPEREPAAETAPEESIPAAPAPAAAPRRSLRWVALAVAVVVVASAAGYFTLGRRAPRRYPTAWDPRVVDLVSFVEKTRGLKFDHPVFVDLLTPGEYHEVTTTDSSAVSAEDKQQMEQYTGVLRAFGLLTGKVDLLSASNTLTDDGTLAFYDPETKRVRVRGTELTPGLRVTVVHELTHALQDQHFDVQRDLTTDGEALGFRALLEGDAMRVENDYVDNMSDDDRDAYEAEYDQDASQADADLADVPSVLTAFFQAPYPLGAWLVDLLEEEGGNRAVDDALTTPPTTEAELLDPFRFLSHEQAQTVKVPAVDAGDKKGDDQEFGALFLYFVLAGRLDQHQALLAADAWDGDAAVDYVHDGEQCVRAAFAAAGGGNELHGILDQWAATMPSGSAVVGRSGDTVTLQSCDPGEGAVTLKGPGASTDSLSLPVTRTAVASRLVRGGSSPEVARCVAGRAVTEFPVERLNEPDPDAAVRQRLREFAAACA